MSIEAIEAVVDLIEIGGVMGQEDIVKCLRSAIEQAERQEPVAYTQGHCKEKAKPGGCQLHNLHCGYPACDRKPVTAPPQRHPLTQEELNHLWETIYDHGNGKYTGEESRAQRERAFEILKRIGGGQ